MLAIILCRICCLPGWNLWSSMLLSTNTKTDIYRTIIFPVVLCGCETWSVTMREEHRLRVFENGVLRKIFEPKRDEVMDYIRGALWSVLLTKYCSGDQIKKNVMGGACSMCGGEERCIQGFCGETWGIEPLGRRRHGWEVSIKMDLQGVGWGLWIGLVWLRMGTGGRLVCAW